ncbi:hypothetical protein F1880_001272 [Penicillium rolfsii]|nr:hypothetical protein F1880_001272 [Penicillium rolfsii]
MAAFETRPGLVHPSSENDARYQRLVETSTGQTERSMMAVALSAFPAERTVCFEESPYDEAEATCGCRVGFVHSPERMRSEAWTLMQSDIVHTAGSPFEMTRCQFDWSAHWSPS